ncbi:MAG: hypothetical protein ABI904_10045 [Chloroflexota bacterium]
MLRQLNAGYHEAQSIYESMPREKDMEEFVNLVGSALQYYE